MRNILVVGSSIGGLTTAYWLAHYGYAVTIVELHEGLRKGGQPIDIRGTGLDVIKRMGIYDRIRECKSNNLGASIVNAAGEEIFRTEEYTFSGSSFDSSDIEILREELVEILADATLPLPNVSIRFADTVEKLNCHDDRVSVQFRSGLSEEYYAVIGADGVHSHIRTLTYLEPVEFYPVENTRFALWSTNNFLGLQQWQTFCKQNKGGTVTDFWDNDFYIRFGVITVKNDRELRVIVTYPEPENSDSVQDWKEYTKFMLEKYPGWISADLIQTLEESGKDFYTDIPVQVRLDTWHHDRIGLVGDAGYCPSLHTGQGSSLALIGAYVIAGELATHSQPENAFTRYEEELRGFILKNQDSISAYSEDPRISKNPEILAQWQEQISGYQLKDYIPI